MRTCGNLRGELARGLQPRSRKSGNRKFATARSGTEITGIARSLSEIK